ncbi:hypothetical protein KAX03_01720 [Candidatus Bathyarchaeota archaeon]|nr:hypothetical protein [Candidatus Bathyarchaeota archaeon]
MSYPKIFQEEIEEDHNRFIVNIFVVENAAIVFFNEKNQILLGTLAVAMPQLDRRSVSSILLGERNAIITKVLAERLAVLFDKMVLVSTHLRGDLEKEGGQVLMKLLQKIVKKIEV